MSDFLNSWFVSFWDWLDNRGVIRRVILGVAMWMTWEVTHWAMAFAAVSARPGIDLAAVIAAVSAPATALSGYVFKAYLDSRAT